MRIKVMSRRISIGTILVLLLAGMMLAGPPPLPPHLPTKEKVSSMEKHSKAGPFPTSAGTATRPSKTAS